MAAPDSPATAERPQGTLTVVRAASPVEAVKFETFIKITSDGSVTAYNGHVDLGTGIRTALGQIVAEELDVSFARVVVVLGDTARVPIRARRSRARRFRSRRYRCARRRRRHGSISSRARRSGWNLRSKISPSKTDWCAARTTAASATAN